MDSNPAFLVQELLLQKRFRRCRCARTLSLALPPQKLLKRPRRLLQQLPQVQVQAAKRGCWELASPACQQLLRARQRQHLQPPPSRMCCQRFPTQPQSHLLLVHLHWHLLLRLLQRRLTRRRRPKTSAKYLLQPPPPHPPPPQLLLLRLLRPNTRLLPSIVEPLLATKKNPRRRRGHPRR